MNTKVLASLGVIVALLTAWLFTSLYTAITVQVQDVTPTLEANPAPAAAIDAVRSGKNQAVATSVMVADQDVVTTVRVVE